MSADRRAATTTLGADAESTDSEPGGARSAARLSRPARLAAIGTAQRAPIESLLRATGVFREAEVVVALEVIDAFLTHPDRDYSTVGAFTPEGDLIGYVCYGPTPCTNGTYDLYWIAVAREAQSVGIGTQLLQEMERRLAAMDARLVIIETSSQPRYAPTRAFYERRGYLEVARVPGFYNDGDDRVIFAKRIREANPLGGPTDHGQVAGYSEAERHDGRRPRRTLR